MTAKYHKGQKLYHATLVRPMDSSPRVVVTEYEVTMAKKTYRLFPQFEYKTVIDDRTLDRMSATPEEAVEALAASNQRSIEALQRKIERKRDDLRAIHANEPTLIDLEQTRARIEQQQNRSL